MKKESAIIKKTVITSGAVAALAAGAYLFTQDCESVLIRHWTGESIINGKTIALNNLKIVYLPTQCLDSLGGKFKIKQNDDFSINIEHKDDHYLYGIYINDKPAREKRHLEIFGSLYKNFTIALTNDEMAAIIKTKNRPLLFEDETGEFSFHANTSIKPIATPIPELPPITYTMTDKKIEACSTSNSKYMDAIRLDFEIGAHGKQEHYQKGLQERRHQRNRRRAPLLRIRHTQRHQEGQHHSMARRRIYLLIRREHANHSGKLSDLIANSQHPCNTPHKHP